MPGIALVWRVVVTAALLLVSMSCGGDEERHPPSPTPLSNLSSSEIEDLHDLAAQRASEGILEPAMPLHLPAGIARLPFDANGSSDHVNVLFDVGPATPASADLPTAIILHVGQDTSRATVLGDLDVDLGGVLATSQSGTGGGDLAAYVLQFRVGNRNMLVAVTWNAPGGELTPAMKSETELVAKSVIADLHRQGLWVED